MGDATVIQTAIQEPTQIEREKKRKQPQVANMFFHSWHCKTYVALFKKPTVCFKHCSVSICVLWCMDLWVWPKTATSHVCHYCVKVQAKKNTAESRNLIVGWKVANPIWWSSCFFFTLKTHWSHKISAVASLYGSMTNKCFHDKNERK